MNATLTPVINFQLFPLRLVTRWVNNHYNHVVVPSCTSHASFPIISQLWPNTERPLNLQHNLTWSSTTYLQTELASDGQWAQQRHDRHVNLYFLFLPQFISQLRSEQLTDRWTTGSYTQHRRPALLDAVIVLITPHECHFTGWVAFSQSRSLITCSYRGSDKFSFSSFIFVEFCFQMKDIHLKRAFSTSLNNWSIR